MRRNIIASLALLSLAACSGGGGSSTPVMSPVAPQSGPPQRVTLSISIPMTTLAFNKRVPKFVSQFTNGLNITDMVQGSTTVAYTANIDLSATSSACTNTANGRNCLTSILAPFGMTVFTFTSYDVPPANANFGNPLDALGTASVTAQINSGTANTVNVALGGIPASIRLDSSMPTLYADAPATFHLGFTALDADGAMILAGLNTVTNGSNSQTDVFAAPLVFTETETNATGQSFFSLNGGAQATSVNVTRSTDMVTVSFGGSVGSDYGLTLKGEANSGNFDAIGTVNERFMSFGSTSGPASFLVGPSNTASFSKAGDQEFVFLLEPGSAANPFVVTATNVGTRNCPTNAFFLNTAQLGPGGSNSFGLKAGSLATSGSGCTFVIGDNVTASTTLSATNLANPPNFPNLYVMDLAHGTSFVTKFTPPFSSTSTSVIQRQPLNSFVGICDDPSGNFLLVPASGGQPEYDTPPLTTGSRTLLGAATPLSFCTFLADGSVIITNDGTGFYRYTPPFTAGETPTTIALNGESSAVGVVQFRNGNIAVSNGTSGINVYPSNFSGAPLMTFTGSSGFNFQGLALSADGTALYAADTQNGMVAAFNLSSISTTPSAQYIAAVGVEGLAVDSAGDIFASVPNNDNILVFNPPLASGTFPNFNMTGGQSQPFGMTMGP